MKTLLVYDSVHGNTEKIARAVGGAIDGEVFVLSVGEVKSFALKPGDLLIVGSPTHGGRATPAIRDFLTSIPAPALQGAKVAAFDTRIPTKVNAILGYAAGKIAGELKKKGGTLITSPEGFFVEGTEGPLKEGEVERAARWAKGIVAENKR